MGGSLSLIVYSLLNTPDSRRHLQTHRQIAPVKLKDDKRNLETGMELRFVGKKRDGQGW